MEPFGVLDLPDTNEHAIELDHPVVNHTINFCNACATDYGFGVLKLPGRTHKNCTLASLLIFSLDMTEEVDRNGKFLQVTVYDKYKPINSQVFHTFKLTPQTVALNNRFGVLLLPMDYTNKLDPKAKERVNDLLEKLN